MNLTSPQFLLLLGLIFSFFLRDQKVKSLAKKWSTKLLQTSVVLLGASLNFKAVLSQGGEAVIFTFLSISLIFIIGSIGGRMLQIERVTQTLITMGTAICGGSAIAALAPVLRADSLSIAVSVGTVFLLNAFSVFLFPPLGDFFNLTQQQFGLWAALAIHDTSSVVAASASYGNEALQTGTTIKLIRALWIIPITLLFSFKERKNAKTSIPIPWFIFGFIAFSLIFTFLPVSGETKGLFTSISKQGFALTLFLIGLSFDWKKMKDIGFRPIVFASALWLVVTIISLLFIVGLGPQAG